MPAFALGWWGPIVKVAPDVRAHHIQPHGLLAQSSLVALHLGVEPGERVAGGGTQAGEFTMKPGADEQIRLPSSGAQTVIVLKLPVQEQIIPARLERDRRRDLA